MPKPKPPTNMDEVLSALLASGIPDPMDEVLPSPRDISDTGSEIFQSIRKARDTQIWALRIRGFSPTQLATHFKTSTQVINNAITRAAAALDTEVPATVVKLELQRLDLLLLKALDVLEGTHVAFSHGKVMYDPNTHEPYIDTAPVLAAINTVLKIQERRSKLLGLDRDTTQPQETDDPAPELQEMIAQVEQAAEQFLKQATNTSTPDDGN